MLFVEIHIDSPFLKETLETCPAMVVTFDQERALPDGAIRMLLWASGGDFERFDSALNADPTVENTDVLYEQSDRRLYRVELTELMKKQQVYRAYIEADAVPIEATGTAEGWAAKMRFPSRAAFKQFHAQLDELDVAVRLQTIYSKEPDEVTESPYNLTKCQEETLVQAYKLGYFRIPRETPLTELSDALDVSSQAASERLRRGTKQLVRHLLIENAQQ